MSVKDPKRERLPVTILSGFLGVGKTTLLERLLNNPGARRIAAIVNNLSDYSVDSRAGLKRHRNVIELKNGCICCTRRDDLIEQVNKVAASNEFDYLVIEATGISEPLPVAANFFLDDEFGHALEDIVRLDTLVTVVDALNFPVDYEKADTLRERRVALDEGDDRSVSDVLAEQVEFANVLVVNKVELVSEQDLRRLEAVLRQLNPNARILSASHGMVPLDLILETGAFDFEQSTQASGWQRALIGKQLPQSAEFDIDSFVYRARRPFHPGRLWDILQEEMPGVIRAKGFFWLATRHNHAGIWSQAGRTFRDDLAGRWWASLPKDEWPEEQVAQEEISRVYQEPYGDRRQELVFIGESMDRSRIEDRLNECLLDDVEMRLGQLGWASFADPFSTWWDEDEGEIAGSDDYPSA